MHDSIPPKNCTLPPHPHYAILTQDLEVNSRPTTMVKCYRAGANSQGRLKQPNTIMESAIPSVLDNVEPWSALWSSRRAKIYTQLATKAVRWGQIIGYWLLAQSGRGGIYGMEFIHFLRLNFTHMAKIGQENCNWPISWWGASDEISHVSPLDYR